MIGASSTRTGASSSHARGARRLALLALAALALLAAPSAHATADPLWSRSADSLAALIPDSTVTVEILAPGYSKRAEGFAVRIEAAARQNPSWFQAYTRSHPRGAPPWHPNLGITRAEYTEYLMDARSTPMVVTQRTTLRFVRIGTGRRWRLKGWGKLAPLEGSVLNLEVNRVEGRRGRLDGMGIAYASTSDETSLPWRWYGVWKSARPSGGPSGAPTSGASLHLGALADDRNVGLYWTFRRFDARARLEDEFLLLRYPKPR